MRILRKCKVCGEEFIATKITNKYCSKRCARVVHRKKEAEKKKNARESKKDDAQNLQSLEIASRPFLTPSDVAFLLGVSVTTVYRCFYSGTLKAVRLRRKTYVRREDLDKYFEEAGAYKKKSYKRKDDQEYYTLREIMEKYNIGRKAVWGRCDRLGIPKVYVGRNTFFSKKAVDAKFADLLEEINLDNYYTMDQVMEMYGMTRTNTMSFVTYHKVPRVNRNGKAYLSKSFSQPLSSILGRILHSRATILCFDSSGERSMWQASLPNKFSGVLSKAQPNPYSLPCLSLGYTKSSVTI